MSKYLQKKKGTARSFADCLPYLLAFLIPVLVMIAVFIERGIFPFGDRSFLRTDLYHQYAPFFKELDGKLQTGSSLFYTWNIGGGSNFVALIAYYLSSPLNWLLLLCPSEYVIEFITYMIVLKIGLSGLTFAWYLRHHTARHSGSIQGFLGKRDIGIALFATFYALSGYMAAYSWNIMWLDCILLFPLIVLGLERLVYNGKPLLYCITLAMAIISNYYIAIMICIFLVLYFICLLFIIPDETITLLPQPDGALLKRTIYTNYPKKIFHFALYSIIAGGLSAFILIPEIFALELTASASSTFPTTFSSYFSIYDMLARHLVNVDVHLGLDHWPNIYCGVAILMFLPLYVMNKRYGYKEKATNFALILIFLASFSMNFLNFIWHGFHYPNSLPARQSFIYIFLILVMCYKGYEGLQERSIKQIVGSFWIGILFIVLAEKLITAEDFDYTDFYISILFLSLYALIAYMYRKKIGVKRALAYVAVLLVFGETFMNTAITSVTTVSRSSYVEYNESYATLTALAQELEGGDFFRLEKTRLRTKNDGPWYQYPSISVFSSLANANMTSLYKALGMEGSTNAYSSTGMTLLAASIMNVRYIFNAGEMDVSSLQTFVDSDQSIYMYKNNYSLPLAFMVPSDFAENWNISLGTPIEVQNNFALYAANVPSIFTSLSVSSEGSSATVTTDEAGYIYAYVTNSGVDNVTVTVNGNSTSYSSVKRKYLIPIGYVQPGDAISVSTSDEGESLILQAYRLEEDAFKEMYETLSQETYTITSFSDTKVSGTITAAEDGLMYTSIPYEKGWTVTVDGQEVDTEIIGDALIGVPVSAGTHTITFTYIPEGMTLGALISAGALALLIVAITVHILLKRRKPSPNSIFVEEELLPPPTQPAEGTSEEMPKKEPTSEAVAASVQLPAEEGSPAQTADPEVSQPSAESSAAPSIEIIEVEEDTHQKEEKT